MPIGQKFCLPKIMDTNAPTSPIGTSVMYGWFIYQGLNLVNIWWYGNPNYRYDVWQTTDFQTWTRISYLQAYSNKQYMATGIPLDQVGKFLAVMEVDLSAK